MPRIEHVLLDADGVLQHVGGGGSLAVVERHLGERAGEFLEQVWELEQPSLRGEGDFVDVLAGALETRGFDVDAQRLYREVWADIELVPESMALVRRLQQAGYGVHLATNQHRQRAQVMRTTMGFDEVFATSVYSWEVGAAKPDPAYFARAAELVGAEPGTMLFVDDRADNVAGAREAGLQAEQWEADMTRPDRGVPRLVELMAAHGMSLDA